MIEREAKEKFQNLAVLIDKAVVKEKERFSNSKELPSTSRGRFKIEL